VTAVRIVHSESQVSAVFLDFDGTITVRDSTDAILETYASADWLTIEEAWRAGKIGSRECLARQMALVTATPSEIESLLDEIEIDAGFVALLEICDAHSVPVYIVSDGFEYCIRRILMRPSLDLSAYLRSVRIRSNQLTPRAGCWDVSFTSSRQSCAHGCATCKPAAMRRLNGAGGLRIFVGDGLSDRYAAAYADVVFAKNQLATYCADQGLAYIGYASLATIGTWLEDRLPTRAVHRGKVCPIT
jgi:2-hydroxy-3-keto-5-methylthiopentenyl-1-phosphate phosphatase